MSQGPALDKQRIHHNLVKIGSINTKVDGNLQRRWYTMSL